MKIDATTFAKLPEHLKVLFSKAPNPGRDEVLAGFPDSKSSGNYSAVDHGYAGKNQVTNFSGKGVPSTMYSDTGSAARFFYAAKASKKDRGDGNSHPTVKPTDLMAYLCRLVTPPGGIILDPFMGSGSTGRGAVLEGFRFIGIEREAQYFEIAKARISSAERQGHQPNLFMEAA